LVARLALTQLVLQQGRFVRRWTNRRRIYQCLNNEAGRVPCFFVKVIVKLIVKYRM